MRLKLQHYFILLIIFSFGYTLTLTAQSVKQKNGTQMEVNGKRIEKRLNELSKFGDNPEGGINRVAYSNTNID